MFLTQSVTLIAYLIIAFLVGNILAVCREINRTKYDVVMDMPLVDVGSQYILISAAENLIRKLLSYAVGFFIADLSGRKGLSLTCRRPRERSFPLSALTS